MAGPAERLGRAALENYSNTPFFNTKAVVKQTGVPAPTLRAWERRYGVLTPYRGENDYRLYSERDIAIIRWLREQGENGLSISQAIALLRTLIPTRAKDPAEAPDHDPQTTQAPFHSQETSDLPATSSTQAALKAEPVARFIQHLFQACIQLDEAEASTLLTRAFALFTVEQVIEDIIQPVLVRVGDEWAGGRLPITIEHFATTLIRSQLETLYHSEPTPTSGPLIIVGCAPGEYHEVGALILALMLRRQHAGLRVANLGQNIEAAHLLESIQTMRPTVVCLSASLPETTQAIADISHQLAALPTVQRPSLVFGGRAFLINPDLRVPIDGLYLHQSAIDSAVSIQQLCYTHPLSSSARAGPTTL
jgi:DNA-binding transcriptional MerR regulator